MCVFQCVTVWMCVWLLLNSLPFSLDSKCRDLGSIVVVVVVAVLYSEGWWWCVLLNRTKIEFLFAARRPAGILGGGVWAKRSTRMQQGFGFLVRFLSWLFFWNYWNLILSQIQDYQTGVGSPSRDDCLLFAIVSPRCLQHTILVSFFRFCLFARAHFHSVSVCLLILCTWFFAYLWSYRY